MYISHTYICVCIHIVIHVYNTHTHRETTWSQSLSLSLSITQSLSLCFSFSLSVCVSVSDNEQSVIPDSQVFREKEELSIAAFWRDLLDLSVSFPSRTLDLQRFLDLKKRHDKSWHREYACILRSFRKVWSCIFIRDVVFYFLNRGRDTPKRLYKAPKIYKHMQFNVRQTPQNTIQSAWIVRQIPNTLDKNQKH